MDKEIGIEYVKKIADELEVRFILGENEHEFRQRVAIAYVEQKGDAIHAMEIASGKDYHEFDKVEQGLSFMLNMANSKMKRKKYLRESDTHFNMSWKYYETLLKNNKFEKILGYEFDSPHQTGKENFGIWIRPDKGFLLTADSYRKDVSSTNLYFELSWRINGREFDEIELGLIGGIMAGNGSSPCNIGKEHLARAVNRDAREGLIEYISELENSPFQTNSPWKFFDEHFLWLCDYSETKKEDYDWKQIARRKIARFPKQAREILGVN
jgi:hypothetical protein